jgi:hypothetical protein
MTGLSLKCAPIATGCCQSYLPFGFESSHSYRGTCLMRALLSGPTLAVLIVL